MHNWQLLDVFIFGVRDIFMVQHTHNGVEACFQWERRKNMVHSLGPYTPIFFPGIILRLISLQGSTGRYHPPAQPPLNEYKRR